MMFLANRLRGAGAKALPLVIPKAHLATGNGSPFLFEDVDLDAPASNREVFVVVNARDTESGNRTIQSATVGGVAATVSSLVRYNPASFFACFFAHVPSRAQGDIRLTLSGPIFGGAFLQVFSVYTPRNIGQDAVSGEYLSTSGSSFSDAVTTTRRSVVFSVNYFGASGRTYSATPPSLVAGQQTVASRARAAIWVPPGAMPSAINYSVSGSSNSMLRHNWVFER